MFIRDLKKFSVAITYLNTTLLLSPGLGPIFKDGTLSMKNRDKWMHQKIIDIATRPTK